jgi:hypothetical protein
MRQIDPQEAVEYLIKTAPAYAQAKADRIYVEEYRKSCKAKLMQQYGSLPIAAQEREALVHPDYLTQLEGLKAAVEREETLRWMMEAARARIEVWRSMESTARAQDRATS